MIYRAADQQSVESSPLNQRVKLFKEAARLREFDCSKTADRDVFPIRRLTKADDASRWRHSDHAGHL